MRPSKKNQQRLAEVEAQLQKDQELASKKNKYEQENQRLRQRMERTQAQIDANTQEHGSTLDKETEINELKLLKKNLQKNLDANQKQLAKIRKQASKDRAQMAKEDTLRAEVGGLRKQLAEARSKRNAVEAGLNSTKP